VPLGTPCAVQLARQGLWRCSWTSPKPTASHSRTSRCVRTVHWP